MAENPLTRLPLAGQLGVSAVIALLICGGFYYFWYSGALEEQRQKEAKLATLQKEIRALEATANRLPEFQREVQALEARLETLKRILPPEKEMPDLMLSRSFTSQRAGRYPSRSSRWRSGSQVSGWSTCS